MSTKPGSLQGFVEVVVPTRLGPLFVHIGEGVRVEVDPGFDASEVRRLVQALC